MVAESRFLLHWGELYDNIIMSFSECLIEIRLVFRQRSVCLQYVVAAVLPGYFTRAGRRFLLFMDDRAVSQEEIMGRIGKRNQRKGKAG